MLAAEPVSVPLESGLPMTAPSQSTNAARLRARTKLFVGGLSYSATDADLTAHFDQFGDIVEAVVICDRTTGRSKGYGFVTYHRAESAAAALKDASPIIAGRKANVNMASGIKRADRTMQYTQRMMGDAGYGVMVDMLGNQILYDPRVAPMPPAHVGQPVYQPVSTPTAHHPQMPAYSPVPWAGLPRATYNPAVDMDGAASMHSYFQPMAPTAVYQQTNPYGMAMTAQPMVGPMAAYPRWVPVQYVADQTQSPQLVQVIPSSAASVTTGVSVTAIADLESQMTTLSMGEGQGSPPQPEKSTTEVSSE